MSPRNTPSPAEPVSATCKIPIVECGEPLVDYSSFCPQLFIGRPNFNFVPVTFVRRSVAEMLATANEALMAKGYRLSIAEGWRSPHMQRRMYDTAKQILRKRYPQWSETKLVRVTNQYSAPLHPTSPPPHTTGGAVDVWLADQNGERLDHTSPYHPHAITSFHTKVGGLSDLAQKHRDILFEALAATQLTNYPSEYWHWSYGDQGWAYRGGHAHAVYGQTEPQGYEPTPQDLDPEPLILFDRSDEAMSGED